eukprot:CCRYP_007921-RB/>CCRYP_007921-RB protein AED:0.04 eAED:0.04 QI:493/1/1/1/1/1/3/137/364
MLVMFRSNFIEHKGKVYASLSASPYSTGNDYFAPERDDLSAGGLYEVTDDSGSCVTLQLLYADDTLGQIVASSQFHPIEIIGVSGKTIYGYYPGSGGAWQRKKTVWGDATDGSLSVEPVMSGKVGHVSGISSNGNLFNLWGGFSNFNYARHDDIYCTERPAEIGDWTGFYAGSRGTYCPSRMSSLKKYTWYSSGSVTTDIGWEPAERIGRLSPTSNIYGISPSGKIIVLWDEKGVAIHSAPLNLGPELSSVVAIGGVDNGYARGFFAINMNDRVYNVYWDGGWKSKLMSLPYETEERRIGSAYFGNFNDQTYIIYGGTGVYSCSSPARFSLFRFDFIGGSDRYDPVLLGFVEIPKNGWGRKLCL